MPRDWRLRGMCVLVCLCIAQTAGAQDQVPTDQALLHAVRDGNLAEVDALLRAGSSADAEYGSTSAMWMAATIGDSAITDRLLKSGAQPDRPSADGTTPMAQAAFFGRMAVVRRLLDADADPQLAARGLMQGLLATGKGPWLDRVMQATGDTELKWLPRSQVVENATEIKQLLIAAVPQYRIFHAADVGDTAALRRAINDAENSTYAPSQPRAADGAVLLDDERLWQRQLRAAKQDQIDVLRLLLQRTRPAPDSHESPVLMDVAAQRGRLPMVEMLLANGVLPRREFGLLAAIIGCGQDPADRTEIVKLMLASGADARSGGALLAAGKEGAVDIMRLLLDAGASPNGERPDDDPPLYFAGTDSVLRMLVAAGADPNRIVRGTTPLDRVVGEGRIASVRALLAAGARPDVGRSSLLTAVKYDIEPEIVRLLVAAGADPFARAEPYGKDPGGTIVEITTRHLALESLQTLLGVPAVAASIRGDSGASVLEIASRAGAASEPEPHVLAVVQCLLTAGAGPNLTQAARHSPALVTASVYGQPTVVRALLAAGALVNGRDNFCHTPLGYLSQTTVVVGRNTEVVRILLEAGADPNLRIPRSYDCKDKSSYATPLFWIADQPQTMYLEVEQAKLDIVKLLIAAKADRNARGPEGKTPAQAADSHGQSDTAELLRKPGGR